jgi:4-hydroxy-tetrahydrodipicolinate synthase
VPYYNKPMQCGIEEHFLAIADATDLPIILHDIPARTNRELADATLARLAQSSRFIGLRDATGDVARAARLRPHLPTGFRLLSGDDATALGFLASGGDGCISVIANIAPSLCRGIVACCRQENWQAARTLHKRLAPLEALLSRDGVPALKTALSMLGLMEPATRLPIVELDERTKAAVAKALTGIDEHQVGAATA